MADNLVSKFTVQSLGTDINIKIKDEDARNLIAQEISDRDSAVTTITNNLNKEISDRSELISKDSSGNTVVTSTNGALYINTKNPIKYSTPQTLNNYFKYIPATDRNGNNYKILVDNGAVFGSDFFSGIVIGCGDSIARGYPLSTNDGTLNKIAEKTGKTINTDFYNVSEDATGFTSLNGAITFRQQIEKLNNVITDKSNVTGIIVIGGTNDLGSMVASTDWANAVDDFITYAHSTYPNAKIAIVSNFMSVNNSMDPMNVDRYLNTLQTLKYPAFHAANLGSALKRWYLFSLDTMSDTIHPNQKGYTMAADFIINKILGGITSDYMFMRQSTIASLDSCYEISGDVGHFRMFDARNYEKSTGAVITNSSNNPGVMGYFNNINLKIRTIGKGGEKPEPWVVSPYRLSFVGFVTNDSGWSNNLSPALTKFMLGNNGKIYIDIHGVDTRNSSGFVHSSDLISIYCCPSLDFNLNYVGLINV